MTPIQASKKANEKKSIPIFKIEELDNKQNINYDKFFVQLILKEFLVEVLVQIGHINYTQ